MQCPECGAEIAAVSTTEAPARCLDCGAAVTTTSRPQATHDQPSRNTYETPFGRVSAQLQPKGHWGVGHQFPSSVESDKVTRLLNNLSAALRDIDEPALARFHSFDAQKLRCLWNLPKTGPLVPLSTLAPPHSTADVCTLVEKLAAALERLHQVGLGTYDLAPELVFVGPGLQQSVLVPTPWLASLAHWKPGESGAMPYVAPELDQQAQPPTPMRSDLFGLGTLAWYLLTARQRDPASPRLPSDVSPELAGWDIFIDGCCRTQPERRFASLAAALDTLPSRRSDIRARVKDPGPSSPSTDSDAEPPEATDKHDDPRQASQPLPPRSTKPKVPKRYVILGVVALLLLVLFLRRDQIASVLPGMSGLLLSYERGFGDTILKYEDRSYDEAKWEKQQDADSFHTLVTLDAPITFGPKFYNVIGWDDESYWISLVDHSRGYVFHNRNGHWEYLGSQSDARAICPISKDAVYVGVGNNLYHVDRSGWTDYGEISTTYSIRAKSLCTVAPDLTYFFALYGDMAKLEGDKITKLPADKFPKQTFVHRQDNTLLKEYRVGSMQLTKTPSEGTAWGIVGARNFFPPWKLVRFQNGTWYEVEEVFDVDGGRAWNAAWLGGPSEKPEFIVLVGDRCEVVLHEIGGKHRRLPITVAQERTSGILIAVWGVSPSKFWVMDSSGTVWQRSDQTWRVVVRGMHRDDVVFQTAWVSPTGIIIANTKDALYRLE